MKKVLILFVGLILNINIANAAIRVSPGNIELDANKTKRDYITGSFNVTGGKDETVRFKVYPIFFEHDSKGNFIELDDKGQKNSLIDKIKFYPTEFSCKDGVTQKVRFTITDLKSLPQGESKLMLFLEDVNTKELALKRADGSIAGKIVVKTRVGVPIYVDKGNYVKRGNLDYVAMKKVGEDYACEYKIASTGNSKIRYTGYGYLSQDGALIDKFEIYGTAVGGGKTLERIQKIDLSKEKLESGKEYKIKFVLTYKDENQREKIMKKEFSFTPEGLPQSKI